MLRDLERKVRLLVRLKGKEINLASRFEGMIHWGDGEDDLPY